MTSKIVKLMGALLLAGATTAAAADFYLEVAKDNRIYVFDDADSYVDWKSTGDLGTSTTRVGAGPDGETLVYMGELSRGMYEARHMPSHGAKMVAEPMAPAKADKPAASDHKFNWKTGKTTWESENARLDLSNRGQFRYTLQDPEDGDSTGSFRVRRMKTAFAGWIYDKKLTYKLQMNWASSRPLEDALLDYDFSGTKGFRVQVGQYKVPFGRQELTSSGKQQFVDRSITSGEFAKGRDTGLMVHGGLADSKFLWSAGIFNGAGINVSSNDNDKYQFVARAEIQPMGDVGHSESDFESKDQALLAFGAGIDYNDKHGASAGVDNKYRTLGFDGAFKFHGFSAVGEFFQRSNELEPGEDETMGAEYDSHGYYLQAGMFIVPKTVEIAVRYATVDGNTGISNNKNNEWGFAVNHFWHKHNLKLQGDVRWLEDEAAGQTDREFRAQMQWIF